jgi:hypothetical protein
MSIVAWSFPNPVLSRAREAAVKAVALFYDSTGPASSHAIRHLLGTNKISTRLVGRQRALLRGRYKSHPTKGMIMNKMGQFLWNAPWAVDRLFKIVSKCSWSSNGPSNVHTILSTGLFHYFTLMTFLKLKMKGTIVVHQGNFYQTTRR